MLKLACAGLWVALCLSFALAAGIIGMPLSSILDAIVRASIWLVTAIGACLALREALHDFRACRKLMAQLRAFTRPVFPTKNAEARRGYGQAGIFSKKT